MPSTTMYINGAAVGRGQWSLKSVKSYCAKKNIRLHEAFSIYACADYATTYRLSIENGDYVTAKRNDHIADMGINC